MGYKTTRIDDSTNAIEEEGFVRAFLIEGSGQAVLLDSCAGGGTEFRDAVASITAKPVRLILSHSDGDHTGGQEYFGAPAMHPSEFALYFSKGNADRPVTALWEGPVEGSGGPNLECVLIPGHTPGSVALLDRDTGRLFTGDSVSDSQIYMFGQGRDLRSYVESLKKLEAMAGAVSVIHPAHGSLSLPVEWLEKTRKAAEMLVQGLIEPSEGPVGMPCSLYSWEGVRFLH